MSKRRIKGEGSVYRRDDGRVVGKYKDTNGRKRYVTSKTRTKAEMKATVRKALENRDEKAFWRQIPSWRAAYTPGLIASEAPTRASHDTLLRDWVSKRQRVSLPRCSGNGEDVLIALSVGPVPE